MALLYVSLVLVLSQVSGQTVDPNAQLTTLQARAKLLEESVRTEEVINQRLQKDVREYGTQETNCYKRLNVATELVKSVTEPDSKCQVPKTIRSCSDWRAAGYSTDGEYTIDPDGPGGVKPFHVECQFSNPYDKKDTRILTIVRHDFEKRTDVAKCQDPLCFNRTINYRVSMDQIVALIKVSSQCEQEVVYDCYASKLLAGGYGAWFSRDGVKMNYWGSAKPGSGQCSCGQAGNCHKWSKTCSCDAGDKSWQIDRGFLTDKSKLPIRKVGFGDTAGADQSAYITVGSLHCVGQ